MLLKDINSTKTFTHLKNTFGTMRNNTIPLHYLKKYQAIQYFHTQKTVVINLINSKLLYQSNSTLTFKKLLLNSQSHCNFFLTVKIMEKVGMPLKRMIISLKF